MVPDEIDLADLDNYTGGFRHDWFTWLRREAPVWWHEPTPDLLDGEGFWVVSRYDDVVQVSRDWQTFSSVGMPPREGGGVFMDDHDESGGVGTMMLEMDPPQHTRYRNIVSKGFTPRVVNAFEEQIRRRATEIVDAVAERGECDFVVDVAAELPLQAIAEILGVAQEDRGRLFEWTNRMVGSQDPEYAVSAEDASGAQMEMFTFANALAAEKRACPADDILTSIIQAEVDGDSLSEFEVDMFFMLLTVAGNETTRNATTHGMLAFFDHPDQWQRLLDHPDMLGTAVEEVLRWASPVNYFRRTAMRDTEIRGVPIAAGQKVTVWYPSANRDEDVFADPFRFDVGREPNPHLAFGGRGPHICLGANLARMELRVIFDELLRRLPDLEQAGDPEGLRMNLITGVKHLPVRFSASERVLTG